MTRLEEEVEARRRFGGARVARLASVARDGSPHIVPVTFALDGDGTVWWAVDDKPKRTRALARLSNIATEPRVSLLVDHYDDDWSALWWVRADGVASVLRPGPDAERGLSLLAQRYAPYREARPSGPVVRVEVERWRWWSAVRSASS
ncbi:MAG TPA: TIGR03668 family PPOX class F420-dependent oxidoreductase [Acidimicrobiales bacterium]|jgi:PPOX class probable F420-dependent enzyme|nr:TIGR03668 family PPOX class F420-dependent oxidoreductase [Acidimicrobiales bacterium]